MSTERKPGSRGGLDPFSREKANPTSRFGGAPDSEKKQKTKGSTKTVSPKRSFKRKPKK